MVNINPLQAKSIAVGTPDIRPQCLIAGVWIIVKKNMEFSLQAYLRMQLKRFQNYFSKFIIRKMNY